MPTRSATRLPRLAFLGVFLLICPPITTARAATELGLITGGEKGTYYQFGLNLQRLGKERGIDLSVTPAATGEPGHLPSLAPGQWHQVPNSPLDAVLPDPLPDVAAGGPEAIIDAWSRGV
jgi:hypothetical protein